MPCCKGKKKKSSKGKEASKNTATAKSTAAKPSAETPAAARAPPAPAPVPPRRPRPLAGTLPPTRRPRRNYFKGDDRYRTTVAAGLTTIAGGGGQVPKKDDEVHLKNVDRFFENWYITETELLSDEPSEEILEPDEASLKKGADALKRLEELEKKFGMKLLTALKKGEVTCAANRMSIEGLPDHKEPPSLEDPRYEAQWW